MVNHEDLVQLNELNTNWNKARSQLATTLLTTYSAVSSGLFLFVSSFNNIQALTPFQKVMLLSIASSAVGIVFFAALEKVLDYFAKGQVGEVMLARMKSQNDRPPAMLTPHPITAYGLKYIPGCL